MVVPLLDPEHLDAGLDTLHPDWSVVDGRLRRSIEFADADVAARFVTGLASRSDQLDHHADTVLRWRWVDLELWTHSAGGLTRRDLELAEIVDEVSASL